MEKPREFLIFEILYWTGIREGEMLALVPSAFDLQRGTMLIDKGFTALAIAERMGHEATDITFRYAHLFPTVQEDMANALDDERGGF